MDAERARKELVDGERARKNETLLLQRLASVGQTQLAAAIGVSESTVSRFKDGEFAKIAKLLAALGVKCVSSEYRCVDPKTMDTLLHGHKQWVNSISDHNELMWD